MLEKSGENIDSIINMWIYYALSWKIKDFLEFTAKNSIKYNKTATLNGNKFNYQTTRDMQTYKNGTHIFSFCSLLPKILIQKLPYDKLSVVFFSSYTELFKRFLFRKINVLQSNLRVHSSACTANCISKSQVHALC